MNTAGASRKYVLVKTDKPKQGQYVARPGGGSSYVAQLQLARTYPTLEEAERDACGNERAMSVEEIVQ